MKRFLLMTILVLFPMLGSKAQFYSASTNALLLGTGTLNGEVSMTLNRNWSLHGSLSLNPWKVERFRIQHIAFQPQIRWWAQESYRGLFVGSHMLMAGYHIGIPSIMKEKYEGVALGGGLGLGYAWTLNEKWNIEAQTGLSYLYASYYRSKCRTCALRTSAPRKGFLAPTNIAISLVYLF